MQTHRHVPIARRHQTCHFHKRATSAAAEGGARLRMDKPWYKRLVSKRQSGHPGVVLPLVVSNSANH